MNDVVINAIQQKIMTPKSLTFSSLRKLAGQDMNAQSSLNRGRAIIDCPTLLNQYLYSYGLMVQRQWNHVVPNIVEMLSDSNDQDIHLYDYGCVPATFSICSLIYSKPLFHGFGCDKMPEYL